MSGDRRGGRDAGGNHFRRAGRVSPGGCGRLRDEARALVGELSALNETNAQLLKQELAFIELYMSILSPDGGRRGVRRPGPGPGGQPAASVAFDVAFDGPGLDGGDQA